MINFFTHLFDIAGFQSKYKIGSAWTFDLRVLALSPNLLLFIFFLYLAHAIHSMCRTYDLNHKYRHLILIPILFALSRLGYVMEFVWPAYRLYILLDWFCGLGITYFCFQLKSLISDLAQLPTLEEQIRQNMGLSKELAIRTKIQEEMAASNETLRLVITKLESMLKQEIWIYDKKQALLQLEEMLTILGTNNGTSQ